MDVFLILFFIYSFSPHLLTAAREAAVKQLNDMVQIEAAQRAEEQEELVKTLEAEVLASLKGQVSVSR